MSPLNAARAKVLAAALLFSTGGAAIKACTLTGWQVACFRSGIAALAMLLVLRTARRGLAPRAWLVGVAHAATLTLFVLATKLTTSANAIFLQSTAPLYLVLLGPLLLREPVRRRDVPFVIAIGAGLALFFVGSQPPLASAPDPVRGNLVALGSGLAWAFTVAGLRWLGKPGVGVGPGGASASGAVVAGNLIAFAACLPLALPVVDASAADVGALLYLGVFQIGLAYALLSSAITHVPALEAALLLLLEPVLNPLWAFFAQGEVPGAWAITGGLIILAAIALRTLTSATPPRDASEP